MDYKQTILNSVESKIDDYMSIVKTLYENPEIGNEEFETMELLTNYLIKAGFDTTKGYVVPTGFIGKYDTGKPGPTIAFMCEYDALPEVGHGCGHNLLGAGAVTGAIMIKRFLEQEGIPGTLRFYGCPEEELLSGKVKMAY